MRNLVLNNLVTIQGDFKNIVDRTICNDVTWFITANGLLYRHDGNVHFQVDLKSGDSLSSDATVLGLEYLTESKTLCIVSTKDILAYHLKQQEVEVVGVVEEGILSFSWSPDQEIVVFCTGNRTCLVMNKNWDVLYENSIYKSMDTSPASLPPQISWRGDGKFYCVNSEDENKIRSIWMFERNGNLVSRNEKKSEIGHKVDWRPDGSIIATSQYNEKGETVILFFEKNGLAHYDFVLHKKKVTVHNLKWNNNSEVLLVVYSLDNVYHVTLWYRSNYHWYLKQLNTFSEPTNAYWDPETPLKLSVISDKVFELKHFSWQVTLDDEPVKTNPCLCSVIDGSDLLFTPLRYALVPPPMSSWKHSFEAPINAVHVSRHSLVVYLSNQKLGIYNLQFNDKPPQFGLKIELIYEVTLEDTYLLTHGKDCLFGIQNGNQLIEIKDGKVIKTTKYNENIIQMAYHHETDHLFTQGASGSHYLGETKLKQAFQHPCPRFQVCTMGQEEVLIGLSERGVLYFQNNIIASNCTSFNINDEYLLFTTFSHLRIVSTKHSLVECIDIATATENKPENDRSIEKGGKLICSVPFGFQVTLQMPRGNLEGIYPRPLVFSHLANLLSEKKYKESVILTRKYKIDMNFVINDLETFLADVELFISQVDNEEYINLFLTQLSHPQINLICQSFLSALQKIDGKKFINCIMTTFAKQKPAQLEEALTYVQKNGSLAKPLTYLIFLSDVNKLFDIALGMYDFDLVMMVAKQSQKDPKEYLPFLAKFSKMEKFYQRFSIDIHLKRFKSALTNLSQCQGPEFIQQALDLIKQENLYLLGLELYQGDVKNQIYEMYGDYLVKSQQYRQAAFVYILGGHILKSQAAFITNGDYYHAFSFKGQKNDYEGIVDILKNQRKMKEAAIVLKDYLNNVEDAVLLLLESYHFKDALQFSSMSNRFDLFETNIKPSVMGGYKTFKEELETHLRKLKKYVNRLVDVRKEEKVDAITTRGNQLENDNFSDTSSLQSGVSSNYSGVSLVSTRSTRSVTVSKDKGKRDKLKKGSPFEEINLAKRIATLIPNEGRQMEVLDLIESLLFFGKLNEAKEVYKIIRELMAEAVKQAPIIELEVTPPHVERELAPKPFKMEPVSKILGKVDWNFELLQ